MCMYPCHTGPASNHTCPYPRNPAPRSPDVSQPAGAGLQSYDGVQSPAASRREEEETLITLPTPTTAADDAADAQPAGTAPTLSMDHIRVVRREQQRVQPTAPRWGPQPGGLPPPARPLLVDPLLLPHHHPAPGGEGSSSPARGSLPPLQCSGQRRTIRLSRSARLPSRRPSEAPDGRRGAPGGRAGALARCAACVRSRAASCCAAAALPTCWVVASLRCSAACAAECATCVVPRDRCLFYHCSSVRDDTFSENPSRARRRTAAARWPPWPSGAAAALHLLLHPLPGAARRGPRSTTPPPALCSAASGAAVRRNVGRGWLPCAVGYLTSTTSRYCIA
ncbi:unnamed protein product [Boreogadus saida]